MKSNRKSPIFTRNWDVVNASWLKTQLFGTQDTNIAHSEFPEAYLLVIYVASC